MQASLQKQYSVYLARVCMSGNQQALEQLLDSIALNWGWGMVTYLTVYHHNVSC